MGINLTSVGIEDASRNLCKGVDASGATVTFRVTDADLASLRSVLYSDLAVNFAGVEVDEADIVKQRERTVDVYGTKDPARGGDGLAIHVATMRESEARAFVERENTKPGAYITYEIREG